MFLKLQILYFEHSENLYAEIISLALDKVNK